jgi:hypothetical protein
MHIVYGDDCVDMNSVQCWAKKCMDGKSGQDESYDKQQSGQPVTATDEFHKKKFEEMIKGYQWITQKETAVKLGISQEHVGHIIYVLQ